MIESCPKKRMIFGLSALATLTLLVLIVESHWTGGPKTRLFPIENNSTCWLREEYNIVHDCQPCTDFDLTSNQGVCIHTHYKEVLHCKSGEIVTRSCDRVAWLDERNFWTFEGLMFVTGAISTIVANLRQRVLDRRTLQKVLRQLAQSV